jgi:uncharacterized protein YndB with AHSA1/START domain
MIGRFLELDPPRRLVIAYGWRDDLMGVPPESTIVEIDLEEQGQGTVLRLVHRSLPPGSLEAHEYGWATSSAGFRPLSRGLAEQEVLGVDEAEAEHGLGKQAATSAALVGNCRPSWAG